MPYGTEQLSDAHTSGGGGGGGHPPLPQATEDVIDAVSGDPCCTPLPARTETEFVNAPDARG